MLVVQPVGGLCNRLRAIDATVSLSMERRVRAIVVWFLEDELNAGFNDLFEMPGKDLLVIDIGIRVGRKAIRYAMRLAFSRHFNGCFLRQSDIEAMIKSQDLAEAMSRCRHTYIRTHSNFWPTETPFALFRPLPALQREIDQYGRDELVGVHIRRTDNVLSIQHSPIAGFVAAMRDEIARDENTRFFLATDDPAVEAELRSTFPGRLVVHEKASLSRGNPLAIRDSVVDLYTLSNCRKLIGSYWSSFSELASRIRGIELHIVYQSEDN